MAQNEKADFKYKNYKLGNNMIGRKGCEYLIKGKWPQLQALDLSNPI